MTPFVLFTLVIAVFLTESVNGQTDGIFTDTPPVDYFQRNSLDDCPLRFHRDLYKNPAVPAKLGERAIVGECQHMAAIGWTSNGKSEYMCGGTLISSKFVLTAAHCAVNIDGKQPDTVRLGDTNLASIEDDVTAQQIKIHSVKKHPKYQHSRQYFDIAVIKLETEARFDGATCSACLWLEEEVPSEEMIAIGFGATGYKESQSPTLQKVKLSAIDKESCVDQFPVSRRLPDGLVNEQFCAGSDYMDTCKVQNYKSNEYTYTYMTVNFQGDSGGPIQIEKADIDGKLVPLIVGIVSFGSSCVNGSFGVYTRIASYREWIEQEIQQSIDYLMSSIYGNHTLDSGKANKGSSTSSASNASANQTVATLSLIPTDEVAHFVNQSRITTCSFPDPDVKLKWLNPKNTIISDTKGRVHIEKIGGSLSLVFESIVRADQGNWTCEADNSGIVLKKTFKMIVNEPISFRDTNIVQTATEDKDATIRCEVRGHPEPSVSWYFNGQPLFPPNGKYTMLADGLLIKKVSKNDSGEYTCKAFQVSSSGSSFEEKTIRLNIKHKPYFFEQHGGYSWGNVTYGYVGGAVNLTCDAIAEPPATFTWSSNNKKFSHKNHLMYSGQHVSMLQIMINNSTVFGKYKCEAKNELGTISREIQLREGTKPDPPSMFQLRGVNSDTLDIDVGATKSHYVDPDHSTIIGYRFELIPTEEYAKHRSWERAHRRDFEVEDGVTYLLVHLIPDTPYLIRVAARNAAGLSEWTEVKEFTTHPLLPHGFNSGAAGPDTSAFLFLRLLATLGSMLLSTVVKLNV